MVSIRVHDLSVGLFLQDVHDISMIFSTGSLLDFT